MVLIKKYLFDVDFDDAVDRPRQAAAVEVVVPEAPPPPPPEPTFTEEQLNAVREQAFEAGRKAGVREGETATTRLQATALQALANNLQALDRRRQQNAEADHRAAIAIAIAMARRVLPEIAARNGLAEIEALFRECMAYLLEEPRVTVRVDPTILDEVRGRLEPIAAASGFEGRLLVAGDAALAVGDCRVEWAEGGAERSMARLWKDIEVVVERSLGPGALPDEAAPEGVRDNRGR